MPHWEQRGTARGQPGSPEDSVCHHTAGGGGGHRGPLPYRQILPDEQAGRQGER